jgi:hypothetical protein
MAAERITRSRGGGVDLRLSPETRALVRSMASQLRELYASEAAADDPAVARLFPTPYLDDPLRSLSFDERMAGTLRTSRLEAIEILERTADARQLTVGEADAWIRTLNDARLVLGTRLEVTPESTAEDYRDDPLRPPAMFDLYAAVSGIVDALVRTLIGD